MPFANLKVPAGSLDAGQKKKLADTVADAYVDIWGEEARPGIMVLVEEVPDGGWFIAGNLLTSDMISSG